MGVVTYSGPPAQVTLSTGEIVQVQTGVSYTFPDVDCTSLLAEYPTRWAAGDSHTASLLPAVYAFIQTIGSWAGPYVSTTTYMKGQVVSYIGQLYVCLADSALGLAPDATPASWSVILPVGQLIAWTLAQAFVLTSATRDSNGAITTASVIWPDGATGTFTTDTASSAFPGAVDAYHVTYVSGATTKTVTQTAVTRDPSTGAVTAQPTPTVS